ncbi:MAG TPA: hypothetical protein VEW26_11660 [Allosphingosinicella sp.]|nr:hypothetical protein [Allosphingosinicella sp.]
MPARLAPILLLFASAAAPVAAQDDGRRSEAERVADEIGRQAEAAAAVAAAVTDSVQRSVDVLRFRGPERIAVERCAPQVERYGRMRVDDVRRHGGNSWRVYGTTTGAALGNSTGWHRGYAPRAFTCTVRDDGRVKLKTAKLRLY